MIIIQEVIYMAVRISRRDRFKGLNSIDRGLESIESLTDLIKLYKLNIQSELDKITLNPTLQNQVKNELGVDW